MSPPPPSASSYDATVDLPESAGTRPDSDTPAGSGTLLEVALPPGGRPPDPVGPPRPDAPPGFEVERELGRGGMGVVYQAVQVGLNRRVALKMVLDAGADPGGVVRFLAEADAAAVHHPNVVEVYAYGEHAGRPFLAMELCPRGSLADLQRSAGGQLPPRGPSN